MQLTYSKEMAEALLGLKGGTFQNDSIISMLAEAAVGIGMPVERGTDKAKQCKALAAVDNFAGVALLTLGMEQDASGVVQYADEAMVPVMQQGRVYVTAGAAIVAGAEVIPATSGKFSTGTSDAVVKAFAVEAAAADGDLVLIQLSGLQGTPAT